MDDDKLRRDEHASVMRSRNLFLGVTLIVVGVLWMMNNLELLSDSLFDVVFSWQMLLVLIGGYLLALRKWLAGGIVAYLVADTVEVEYLSVQERFRGRSIARALLARVESQAQERGARKILLNTYGFQAPGLYRHLGFQEVATIADVLGTSWHIFLKRI